MAYLALSPAASLIEWVGPHRLGLPLHAADGDLALLRAALLASAQAMVADRWWP